MGKETVLVVGSGGREHTLAWALARSARVGRVYVAPGNAGTTWAANPAGGELRPLAPAENVALAVDDLPGLVAFARQEKVNLTVVGPEVPLAAGIVDAFQAAELPIFGPTRAAAQLEASKGFAREFMHRHNIPTADYRIFDDYEAADDYLRQWTGPVVVKADGLAAGKGVIVCDEAAQGRAALRQIMVERAFGQAGQQVVIEERLSGPEISILAWSDGQAVVPIVPARDHKRAYEGDRGPNTGGMGAYTPAPDVDAKLVRQVQQAVLEPAVAGMAAEGTPYVGILYAGLMLTAEGPKVLEFNCRFGDPETQAVLPLLETDLLEICLACLEGRLAGAAVQWQPGACATIVMASPGYPASYPRGLPINGLDEAARLEKTLVFQAGTARQDGQVVTAGGRVLAVSALGDTLPLALERAYRGVDRIEFEGAHYRRDIGQAYRSSQS